MCVPGARSARSPGTRVTGEQPCGCCKVNLALWKCSQLLGHLLRGATLLSLYPYHLKVGELNVSQPVKHWGRGGGAGGVLGEFCQFGNPQPSAELPL